MSHDQIIVSTKTERKFIPYRLLLRCAEHHLSEASENKAGSKYALLSSIVFSALSIEAIGNTYGELLISNWEDFESISPRAKLRLIAERCGIKPDFGKEPWQTVAPLIGFRNKIAHARPKHLKIENEYELITYRKPKGHNLEADVEKLITQDFAAKSYNAVDEIVKLLNKQLTEEQLHQLTYDGHMFHVGIKE